MLARSIFQPTKAHLAHLRTQLTRPVQAASAGTTVHRRWRQGYTHFEHDPTEPRATRQMTFMSMLGERCRVEAIDGETLLETARRYNVPIPGAEHFGDGPMCRHCHVYVDTAHLAKLEPKVDEEVYLTEKIHNQTANSRFACEIIVNAELEGLTIVVPEYVDRL